MLGSGPRTICRACRWVRALRHRRRCSDELIIADLRAYPPLQSMPAARRDSVKRSFPAKHAETAARRLIAATAWPLGASRSFTRARDGGVTGSSSDEQNAVDTLSVRMTSHRPHSFRFRDFASGEPADPFVIVRHDVDYSPAAALRLAEQEAERGSSPRTSCSSARATTTFSHRSTPGSRAVWWSWATRSGCTTT